MAYYLSKRNRIFLSSIIDQYKLKDATEDLKLITNSPNQLADILRNAASIEEFEWLKSKFTYRVREGYLYCKLLNPTISNSESRHIEPTRDVEKIDFFTVANKLVMEKPDSLTTPLLKNEEDLVKLELWCLSNDYTIEKTSNSITFTKSKSKKEDA